MGKPRTYWGWLKDNGDCLTKSSSQKWSLIITDLGCEFKVASICSKMEIPFFVPHTIHKKHPFMRPLLTQYMFCRVNAETREFLYGLSLIQRIDEVPNETELLHWLRDIQAVQDTFSCETPLLGDRTLVIRGRFTGIQGMIIEADNGFGFAKLKYPVLHGEAVTKIKINKLIKIKSQSEFLPGLNATIEDSISNRVQAMNADLIKFLAKHPDILYKLPSRRFEILVADLLSDMGCDVRLTPETRDKGRDILAVFPTPLGEILTVVECKRYNRNNKIGPDIVERLLWIADHLDKASCAMIATTSFFTTGARELEHEYRWRLMLKDYYALKEWLDQYGKWKIHPNAGLWLPSKITRPT